MKKYLLIIIALTYAIVSQGQIYNPVSWSYDSKHIDGDNYELTFVANIEDGWTVYSQYLESDDGPVATTFEYDAGDHYALNGKTEEDKLNRKEGFDKIFQMNVTKFAKKAIFRQKIKVSDYSKPVAGYLTFMTCDATKCLPPTDVDFEFKIAKQAAPAKKVESGIGIVEERVTTKPTAPKADKVITVESNNGDKAVDIQISQPKIVSRSTPTASTTTKKEAKPAPKKEIKKATETVKAAVKNNDILKPVTWDIDVKKTGADYTAVWTANIDKGWTIYSQHTSDDGPVPTSFNFDPSDQYELDGTTQEEGKRKEGYDKLFDTNVIKFVKGPVTFTQKIKSSDPTSPITGYLTFMTCDDARCLPPTDVDYVIFPGEARGLIGNEASNFIETLVPTSTGQAPSTGGENLAALDGLYPGLAANVDLSNPQGNCSVKQEETPKGFFGIFILGFLGGLLALLTPCVFPMIPLTVSFFTKSSDSKSKGLSNAVLYGAFILGVYLLLSMPFHLLDTISPDILNEISTNVYLNIAFFAIFLFFAFSFFGYYEITLPESWTNKSSSAEGAGGVLGIFFMALTLALVSFSCTGPILGSLLAGALSSDGGAWQLTAGMGGFGLALALPFALFAAFPGMMNSLPSSGGWLNTVKVVLGFIELALAFKFLSNADLVSHWGLLKIEVFLGIWILCFLGLGIYLLGFLKFPHDSPLKKLSPLRGILGVLSIAFAGYMATGFMFDKEANSLKSLTLLSGLAPPSCYSIWNPCDCPSNLQCFKDLDEGLAFAKENNKPILIDFTGYACVNCRKMEEHVWPKKEVYNVIDKNYVLISLYVDDRKKLEESHEVPRVSGDGNRKLRTYGNKWAYFQTKYFGNNSQPYYALVSPDLELLTSPVGYTPDANEYKQFLECGVETFNSKNNRLGSK